MIKKAHMFHENILGKVKQVQQTPLKLRIITD